MSKHLYKLVSVLKAFDKPALKRFDQYLKSPYFNVPEKAAILFDYLQKIHPEFEQRKLSPDVLAKKAKSLKKIGMQAKAGTELLGAAEKFLALENWLSDKSSASRRLLQAYKEKNLLRQFGIEHAKILKAANEVPEHDLEVFFHRHRLMEILYNGFDAKLNRTQDNDLTEIVNTLDEFYAVKRVRYICEVLNRKMVLGIGSNTNHVGLSLEMLTSKYNDEHPYIYLFINVYNMLKADSYEDSLNHYYRIKEVALAYNNAPLPQSILESMTYAINWCLYWNSKGFDNSGKEYLWWTEFKIRHGVFLENDLLMPITFRNIVSLLVVHRTDTSGLKKFIDMYSAHLPILHRDTNSAFAYGLYYYKMKDFIRAQRSLVLAQAGDETIFNAIIRRWQFLCMYESGENAGVMFDFLSAFERYLSRHEASFHQIKPVFVKFVTYAQKLVKMGKITKDSRTGEMLERENFFAGKDWLLKQFKGNK